MADLVIGLDLGTGGVRAIAVDLQGQIVAQATSSYPLLTPQPGWTEVLYWRGLHSACGKRWR